MHNSVAVYVSIFLNITHNLFYLRLNTRNPWRYLLLYTLIPLLWPPVVWLAVTFPYLMPLAFAGYIACGMWLFRLLVTDDHISRIFLSGAMVLSFTQVLRLPGLFIMIYVLGWPGRESFGLTTYTYPATFFLVVPLILLYVRERVRQILDVAETRKWYLVGLQPMLLTALGVISIYTTVSTPDAPGMEAMMILTPVVSVAYFITMYHFLVSHRDKLVYRQRLEAAEQLEETYGFYSKQLSEKESRLRTLRHDFRHMALHLDALAEQGDIESLRKELRDAARLDNADVAVTPFCENHTVNAVVSFHFAVAGAKGVNCVANAFVPAKLPLADADVALVLGNALENCVKGAGPLGELGYITFDAKPAKASLVFTFSNNYRKRDFVKGEGAGLASIRELCERHEARMEVTDTGEEFTVRIFLLMV